MRLNEILAEGWPELRVHGPSVYDVSGLARLELPFPIDAVLPEAGRERAVLQASRERYEGLYEGRPDRIDAAVECDRAVYQKRSKYREAIEQFVREHPEGVAVAGDTVVLLSGPPRPIAGQVVMQDGVCVVDCSKSRRKPAELLIVMGDIDSGAGDT